MHNLNSYMHQVEQSIAGAFVNDKLAIHLLGGVQGPHTLTFAMKLYQPTKSNVAKALALSGAIEATTGISPVRVYAEQGAIMVEVPSPSPVVIYGRSFKGQGLAIPLGMTSRRAITGIDFETNPHLLFVGPTGRGKTTGARGLAYHLAKQNPTRACRFIVSTFKPKDWKTFSGLAHTMAVITNPAESAQMVKWLTGVMYERTKNEIDTPHLFVFLDDLLNLLAFEDVSDQLGQLASLGRGAGIHLIIGTQRLNERGSGSAIVTGNIPTRLVFGTASAQDASAFSGRGESGAEKLGHYPGDALLMTDGAAQRLAVAYVTDDDMATLERNPDDWRPWQRKLQRDGQSVTALNRHASVTPNRHTTFTPENGAFNADSVTRDKGVSMPQNSPNTPLLARDVTTVTRLPDAPPTVDEQEYLRNLYIHLGSKRAALNAAWGGVVSADGNTPKTRRWLDEALGEQA